MRRSYHFKWCLILILTLTVVLLLLRAGDLRQEDSVQYLGESMSLTIAIILGWIVQVFTLGGERSSGRKHFKTLVSIVLSVVLIAAISYLIRLALPEYFFPPEKVTGYARLVQRLMGAFFATMLCYVVYSNVDTADKLQRTMIENEQFKQAHLRAQLLSLKQQISPHFLFNSLSTLKTMSNDTETKSFVIQLANVYRYLLNSNTGDVSRLSEELRFIDSYLYILRHRFEEALRVSVNIPDSYHQFLIPPLSLQLLIENAVKHNALSPEKPLCISIEVNDKHELLVTNCLQPKRVAEESTGLGLQNIRDRYQLLFNKTIGVVCSEESFTVSLPLISNERYHN